MTNIIKPFVYSEHKGIESSVRQICQKTKGVGNSFQGEFDESAKAQVKRSGSTSRLRTRTKAP